MKLTNAAAFKSYLNKPKALTLTDGTLYVKQLKIGEHEQLQKQVDALQDVDETDVGASTAAMGKMTDILISLLVDEDGRAIFSAEEDIAEFKADLTLDFVREFFDCFWASFAFTSKELAAAESKFRQ